jgi:hypothetical protein
MSETLRRTFALRFIGTAVLLCIVMSRVGYKFWCSTDWLYQILWGAAFVWGFSAVICLGAITFSLPDEEELNSRISEP